MTPKKFKAVTKEGNIIDVVTIQFMEDGSCIVNDEFPIEAGKLLQFTGKLDKDGVEIYDGNIIKTPMGNIVQVVFGQRVFKFGKDRIECNGWLILNPKTGYTDLLDETIYAGEIIGNVFQNPDLLK